MRPPAIRVGLLGLGTVGSGVIALWRQNRALIERRIGARLLFTHALVRHPRRKRDADLRGMTLTTDPRRILAHPDIHVVAELLGGERPALDYLLQAMRRGKHVVTANKLVLAKHWTTLMTTARRHGVDLYLEAAVGGGIPLIQALHDGLAANDIRSLYGIVNGTTNYILTRMLEGGMDFPAALKEAQARGLAEADSSMDVSGVDSAHKLAILSAIAFNRPLDLRGLIVEGITDVTREALVEAKQHLHHAVKLLAIARRQGDRLEVRVHPTLIPDTHLLAAVGESNNGVYITGDATGPLMFYGQGAGRMPTASAVLSDIIYVARDIAQGVAGRVPSVQYAERPSARRLLPMADVRTRYYLRLQAVDRPGVFASIAGILGRHDISLASVLQIERNAGKSVPVVLTTHEALEGRMQRAREALQRLPAIKGRPLILRIESAL